MDHTAGRGPGLATKTALALLLIMLPFLAQALPAKIVVVCDNNYPPYAFLDGSGRLQGIVPDQWAAWSKATGVAVELRGMSWSVAIRTFEAGRADVLDTVFETPERRASYDFTPAYATIEVPVFIHKSISGISTAADLKGFRVAVKDGDASIAALAAAGIDSVDLYPDYVDIIRAAANLEVRIFCVDKPPALYYLYKLDADRDFRIAFILNEGSFHRAVLKGRAELLALVEKGFASVDKGVYTAIDRSWLGAPIASRIDLRLLALVLAALTILLVVFGTSAWILRRRVNVATSALREKIGLLEASEAKNRAFISALPDLFFVIDREGRYLDFSASDPSKLALPPSAFLGKRFVELGFPAAAIEAFMANLERTLRTGEISVFDYSLPVGMETLSFEGRIVALSPDRALLVSRDITDVHRQEERLRRSLAEKEILLKEIHHRVKNNMQVISSLIALQAESFRDEGDRLLLAEAQQRIRAMARLHELLYDSPDLESIGAIEYLESLSGELAMGYGSRPVRISGPAALRLTIDQAVPFGLIANELASNALKYAYPRGEGGEIDIHLSREEGRISLVVEDHGRGLEPGLDPLEAKSMGFLLVRSLAAQLGGRLDFGGPPGVRVRLVFDAD